MLASMVRRPSYAVVLSRQEGDKLEKLIASESSSEWQVKRARALVAMSKGDKTDDAIALELDIGRSTMVAIRKRFQDGMEAVLGMQEPGTFSPNVRPVPERKLSRAQVVTADRLHSEGVSYRQLVRKFAEEDGIKISPEGIRKAIRRDTKREL